MTLVSGSVFQDSTSSDFNNGTFFRTFYNSSGFVQINISQGFFAGNFSGRIFDGLTNSTWQNISWFTELCYGCELPNNNTVERGNFLSPVNMSGNVLLAHLNELSGNITDYSIYNNTGKVRFFEGTEYGASGKFNTSLDFEANDSDFVNFTSPSHLSNLGSQLTLEAWVNPESFNTTTSNGFPTFIDKDTNSFSFYFDRIGTTNTANLVGLIVSSNSNQINGNKVFDVDNWYHVVVSYNGSQVRLYTNGILDGTPVNKTGNVVSNSKDLLIGSGWGAIGPGHYQYDGKIDEVAIYNRSLNAEEIKNHYLRGALRLNISVRSCDDNLCNGEIYVKLNDSSSQNLNVSGNRYFQYKTEFTTENNSYSPRLYNTTLNYISNDDFPEINITYPNNNSNYSFVQTIINYTVFDSNLNSCWYTLNNGLVNTSVICGTNITGLSSVQGNNNWKVYVNDSSGSESFSGISFFVDSISPSISILTPSNNSISSNSLIFVNYSVSDSGVGLSFCWWTNSSGLLNNSVACGTNFSFNGLEGNNFVTVYSNDSFGNVNSSTTTIRVDTLAPVVNILSPITGSVWATLQTFR